MPNFVRCSSEFGRWVQTLSSESNEPMTVVLDRIMARYKELEIKIKEMENEGERIGSANNKAPKRAKASARGTAKAKRINKGAPKLVEGTEDLIDDIS